MAQESLIKLMYASSSTKLMSANDLDSLMRKSRHKNSHFGVTGCLIYHEGNILQYLEGSKASVDFIYHSILQDERHHGIQLLCRDDTEQRVFEDWTMALRHIPVRDHSYKSLYQLFENIMDTDMVDRISVRARIFFETFLRVSSLQPGYMRWYQDK